MVSIVILARNKAAYTRACLASLLKTEPPELELIVVDNGSTDETPAVLEEAARHAEAMGVGLRVISHKQNVGCSTGRNQGVAAASGDEVVFLDNDTEIRDAAWLLKLRKVLTDEKDAAIVGPKLCYPFEPKQIQCAGVAVSPTGRILFRGRGCPPEDPRFNRAAEVQALISACFIFRRSLYDEIGGLDEIYNPIQYEDLDFCYRARERGHRVIYTPDPVIYHWESITSDQTRSFNNRYVIIKHGMIFKRRWRHMFEKENGPGDDETRWEFMDMPSLEGRRRR